MATFARFRFARRARRRALFPPSAVVAALGALATTAAHADEPVERIVVTGRTLQLPADVAGFAGVPPARLPMSVDVVGEQRLLDAGAQQLSALTRFDASVGDAYNAEGYWSNLTVRGFVLDNRTNYRRDGLPVNAETALPLAAVERIELLKGTSGIQAGISSPGGLVNLVVKRPDVDLRSARVEWREDGTLGAAADLSHRFGAARAFGLRLNAYAENLDPPVVDARGQRRQFALAGDWRASAASVLEAEVDWAHQRQPSVPGFSLLGDRVPEPASIDPRINLNNQPWSTPSVFDGTTASLRWRQQLDATWRFTAHALTQRLDSDDRVAFPYGCYDAAVDVYYADRYCPDGTFDLYDFRSDGERRRSDALDLQLAADRVATGPLVHTLAAGVLFTRFEARFQRQAFNYAGTGNIAGMLVTDAAPELTDENTNRDERSTEWYLRDRIDLAPAWQLWAGLRHTRLDRESVRTDGSRPTAYEQSATLPWLALSRQWTPQQTLYASWGEGLETDVAPNTPRYTNAGEPLPALKSRQVELGWKLQAASGSAGVALFQITRPLAADLGACDEPATCTRAIDGEARHRGVEAQGEATIGAWRLAAGAMWLDAERRGSSDASINGLRPTNVPERSLRLGAEWRVPGLDGLSLGGNLLHEGDRVVLPDNSATTDAWTRLDLAARWVRRAGPATWTLRVGVDNVTDERAWTDTPYQFGHAYLFPMAPRTWRVSLQADL